MAEQMLLYRRDDIDGAAAGMIVDLAEGQHASHGLRKTNAGSP